MRKKKFAARASSPSRNRSRLAVSKKSQLKSRLCPNRSRLQRLVVSKKSQLKSRLCPNSISRSHHKEASAFFFLPSCISPASFCIFARKRLSFFVIFFGIFYVFFVVEGYTIFRSYFFAKNRGSVGLKIRHIKIISGNSR